MRGRLTGSSRGSRRFTRFAGRAPARRRTNPMITAHFLINAVAFIGCPLLAPHVSWLP